MRKWTRDPVFVAEFAFNAVLVVGAALFIHQSIGIGIGSLAFPGPGLFPFGAAALLEALLVLRLAQQFRDGPSQPGDEVRVASWRNIGVTVYVALVSTAYVVVLEPVGFLISTFIWMGLLFALSDRRNLYWVIGGAAATALVSHLLFGKLFGLQLPCGIGCV